MNTGQGEVIYLMLDWYKIVPIFISAEKPKKHTIKIDQILKKAVDFKEDVLWKHFLSLFKKLII